MSDLKNSKKVAIKSFGVFSLSLTAIFLCCCSDIKAKSLDDTVIVKSSGIAEYYDVRRGVGFRIKKPNGSVVNMSCSPYNSRKRCFISLVERGLANGVKVEVIYARSQSDPNFGNVALRVRSENVDFKDCIRTASYLKIDIMAKLSAQDVCNI